MSSKANPKGRTFGARVLIDCDKCAANDLAAAIGLEPDDLWTKGTLRGSRSTVRYTSSGISYGSRRSSTDPPADQLAALRTRLHPYAESIRAKAESGEAVVRIWLTLTVEYPDPVLSLDAETLAFAASLGAASIDLSILVFR